MIDFKDSIAKLLAEKLPELTEAEIKGMVEIPQDQKKIGRAHV